MMTEPSVTPENDPFPEGSVDAGVYATHREGFEHGLVVLAMGEACWLIEAADGHHLRVEPAALDAVRGQLACFDRESAGWPPKVVVEAVPAWRHPPLSPWLWVLGVFAVFWAQWKRPGLTDAGLLDAERVFGHGEWWRAASALWLHADAGHLISNAGGGLLVFSAVVMTFGLGVGWWLLAGSAIAGNLAAVVLHHGEQYRSLGASTAVFAGLGLLTGRAIRVVARSGDGRRWRALAVPLASGLVVLGLFGAGGVNIDVLAHATGFGAGVVTGFAAGGRKRS
ncbi:MAG TPA: rhomboid family intramembrane serine protease [Roseimicrobium sp.]|nr:rhomboid family intramembrane serine protease [Roseimicrobium sp.]